MLLTLKTRQEPWRITDCERFPEFLRSGVPRPLDDHPKLLGGRWTITGN
jgi:hypothetical protein